MRCLRDNDWSALEACKLAGFPNIFMYMVGFFSYRLVMISGLISPLRKGRGYFALSIFWSCWLLLVPVKMLKTKVNLVMQRFIFVSEGMLLPWLDCGQMTWKSSSCCLPVPLKQQSARQRQRVEGDTSPLFFRTAVFSLSIQVAVVVVEGWLEIIYVFWLWTGFIQFIT